MNYANLLVIIISVMCKVFGIIEVEYIDQRITVNQNGKSFGLYSCFKLMKKILHYLYGLKLSNFHLVLFAKVCNDVES